MIVVTKKFSRNISSSECKIYTSNIMVNWVENFFDIEFDDLNQIQDAVDVENAIQKYSTYLENTINVLNMYEEYAHLRSPNELIDKIFDMICKACNVPNCKLGYWLCNKLRDCGGLDLLINNCVSKDQDLQFSSARLLKQCLTTENSEYVLEKGVDKVMQVICEYKKQISSVDKSNVSTGILENLFKHKKIMCSGVMQHGGLDVLLYEYRHRDIVTLEQCASALANLSLYGEPENQDHMIRRNVPTWLFTLVFNTDVDIKYYAFLAIVVLVTNKEDKVTMINPEHLNLINPSVTTHISTEFTKSSMAPHTLGQSQNWLKKLVPVLSSSREEACNLAAFYFCMDAGIKRQRGVTSIFRAINAIGPLRRVASYGNIIASKLAAKALRLIDDGVPYKLSRNVPEWSVDDVHKWATQSELNDYANNLSENLVDGDLLLQITEENLKNDIGIKNGIMIKRFMRELDNLKQSADYSSKDPTGVQSLLESIGSKYTVYTYPMLNAGINRNSIRELTADQIVDNCGITNSIHQSRIRYLIEKIHSMESSLDVFISYRRSNGSQLASLIKAYLEIRDYRVFIDVVRLENGNFGHNLLKHLKLAKNFVLVLTQNSLDRCVGDNECNDWVHKEIVTAMQNRLNIIPIIAENFTWPELLPADMRDLRTYNAIQWSCEFQNECMDSISMAIRGDLYAV
ncbi:NAD(+) hydrolase sarm1-like isoform X2 [Rhopalosiphum padi]|uniref:NAD(+) hydrolase sarm1-like isoform X2 n=1 Tax=Rhopalosiphum padi TaxID=40932 RepID=UPI00298E236D|nr:NAD(+) hydrolase sarm1-like isoform X2 [Rhopalosiphum padi]